MEKNKLLKITERIYNLRKDLGSVSREIDLLTDRKDNFSKIGLFLSVSLGSQMGGYEEQPFLTVNEPKLIESFVSTTLHFYAKKKEDIDAEIDDLLEQINKGLDNI